MSKITITIEANSIEEVYEILKLKTKNLIYNNDKKETEDRNENNNPIINNKFKLETRNGKSWTEFEINFLVENYRFKNCRWIGGKLGRKPTAVYQKLLTMYEKGLQKKRQRVKTIND